MGLTRTPSILESHAQNAQSHLTEVESREEYLVCINKHQVAFLQLDSRFHWEDLYLLDGGTIDWPQKCLSVGGKQKKEKKPFFLIPQIGM